MNPLSSLIEKFSSLRVLVIGDLMVDAYTWGKVNRISPEAPVPALPLGDRHGAAADRGGHRADHDRGAGHRARCGATAAHARGC